MTILIMTQLINGLISGVLITLIAIGMALTAGLLKVINLSHAAIYTLGAYVGFTTFVISGNFWIALVLGAIVAGIVGTVIERFCIRPVYRDPDLGFLMTFSILMGLTQAFRLIWGPANLSAPQPSYLMKVVYLGFIPIPSFRLFCGLFGICLMVAIWILIKRTNIGLIVRASLDNKNMVDAFGINSSSIFTLVFAMGSAVAGLCGVLGSPIFGLYPDAGTQVLVLCFVVITMGGFGSIRGAMLAGPIIGVVSSLTSLISPGLSQVMIFLVMVVILFVKPTGFFGDKL